MSFTAPRQITRICDSRRRRPLTKLPLLHLTILLPPQSVDFTMIVQVFAIIPRWESWVPSFLSNFADMSLSVCRLIVQVLSGEGRGKGHSVDTHQHALALDLARALFQHKTMDTHIHVEYKNTDTHSHMLSKHRHTYTH
jgi:hypothetical protein